MHFSLLLWFSLTFYYFYWLWITLLDIVMSPISRLQGKSYQNKPQIAYKLFKLHQIFSKSSIMLENKNEWTINTSFEFVLLSFALWMESLASTRLVIVQILLEFFLPIMIFSTFIDYLQHYALPRWGDYWNEGLISKNIFFLIYEGIIRMRGLLEWGY